MHRRQLRVVVLGRRRQEQAVESRQARDRGVLAGQVTASVDLDNTVHRLAHVQRVRASPLALDGAPQAFTADLLLRELDLQIVYGPGTARCRTERETTLEPRRRSRTVRIEPERRPTNRVRRIAALVGVADQKAQVVHGVEQVRLAGSVRTIQSGYRDHVAVDDGHRHRQAIIGRTRRRQEQFLIVADRPVVRDAEAQEHGSDLDKGSNAHYSATNGPYSLIASQINAIAVSPRLALPGIPVGRSAVRNTPSRAGNRRSASRSCPPASASSRS